MNKKNGFLKIKFLQRGFSSLAELGIVMGLLILVMSIGVFSLTRAQSSSSISTTLDIFKSDFKNQQLKAMLGDTEAGSTPDNYGIHFATNSYSLFRGSSASADLNKFVIDLPPTVQITTFFLNDDIIFLKGSGEIAGCCAANTITFKDSDVNIEKTINVNRYGTITVN